MNILITGSHGFVGRAFRRALPHANLTLVDLKNGVDCRKLKYLIVTYNPSINGITFTSLEKRSIYRVRYSC